MTEVIEQQLDQILTHIKIAGLALEGSQKVIKDFIEMTEEHTGMTGYVASKTKEYRALKALIEEQD